MDLRVARKELADAVSYSYSPDDFPGSKNWKITRNHQAKLDAFDTAHPEVKAAIDAERTACAKSIADRAIEAGA